jgi:uncharacterized protein (DUF302 family)
LADNGIASLPVKGTVQETIAKLQQLLAAKGVAVFAVIDHSGEAQKVGLSMRPTQLLIFGSPKAGTPLMQAAPKRCHRSAAQDSGVGRCAGRNVALV